MLKAIAAVFVLQLGIVTSQSCSALSYILNNTARQSTAETIVSQETYIGLVLPVQRPNIISGAVCGPISEGDIIKIEAFFWALRTSRNRWKNNTSLIPGIVFSSCSSADRLYEHLAQVENGRCDSLKNRPNVLAYLVSDRQPVSQKATQVLEPFNATLLSVGLHDPVSEMTSLSNLYYMSPPADKEALAIVDVLSKLDWGYVQVVYVDDGYGRKAYETFTSAAEKNGVSVGRSVALETSAASPQLDPYPYTVVVFAYADQKVKLLTDLGKDNFIFVTTNIGTAMSSAGGEGDLQNTKILELRTAVSPMYNLALEAFKNEVVSQLSWAPTVSTINPWYRDFLENRFQCNIPGVGGSDFESPCNTSTNPGRTLRVDDESVAAIIQGVDLALRALKRACPTSCRGQTLRNMRNQFKGQFRELGVDQDKVFDSETHGLGSWEYVIHWLSWDDDQKTVINREVGSVKDGEVMIGEIREGNTDRRITVTEPMIFPYSMYRGESHGTRFDQWGYIWVIIIGILAGLGIILVLVIAILLCVLMRRGAMSGYVWLYAVLLFGALLGYLTLFAFIPVPTTATCGIIRFGVGLSYGICFSVMVILGLLLCKKTEMFSSTRVSTIFIAVSLILLIAIELVILITWMVLTPPGVVYAIFPGIGRARTICNHYTLKPGIFRTTFENHLIHLVYIMLLILLVLILAIFIFMRRRYLSTSRNKTESYALLAAGIGTGIGTVIIWLIWTLVGALVGVLHNDVQNYGDAAIAFGLWFTLTWLLLFLLVQIINAWRGPQAKLHKTKQTIKVNMNNLEKDHSITKEEIAVSTVDGRLEAENNYLHKTPLIVQANGGSTVTSYEQHVETKVEKHSMNRPPSVPENQVLEHPKQERVFIECAETGFIHNPHALHIVHPRGETSHSSHDASLEYIHHSRGLEGLGQEPRMAASLQALHLLHPRSRPVSRAGSLDMGHRRVHTTHTRVARSEIGTSNMTHGTHYGPNVIDLRRPRHHDRTYYYPASNVYFTEHGRKGTSVI